MVLRLAQAVGGAVGLILLAILVAIVLNRIAGGGGADRDATGSSAVVTDVVPTTEPTVATAPDAADDAAGGTSGAPDRAADGAESASVDTAEREVDDGAATVDPSGGGADAAESTSVAGRYTGTFDGTTGLASAVVDHGSITLEVSDSGTVSGSLDVGLAYPEAFDCSTVDEYQGEIGEFPLTSGTGETPLVLTRFFPACADPALAEELPHEAVFSVTMRDGSLAGQLALGGEVMLGWEADPAG